MDNTSIVLAGATGNLGGRIARALLHRGAGVIALVRHGSAPDKAATAFRSFFAPLQTRQASEDDPLLRTERGNTK